MDISHLENLRSYVNEAKKFSKYIDSDNSNFNEKTAKNITAWKANGFTVEQALIGDIFNWLCYLGLGDGYIADEEVTFINHCLDLKFSKEDISNLTTSNLTDNYKKYLPISFIFFHEADITEGNTVIANKKEKSTKLLFNLFGRLGYSFIKCDGFETREEFDIYREYIGILDKQLKNLSEDLNLKNVLSISYDVSMNSEKNLNELLDEFNHLIALNNVKPKFYSQFNFIQIHRIREAMGLKEPPILLNSIFVGMSGTGKTTVARLLSKIYFKMGLISKGHIKEINADDLVDYSIIEINNILHESIRSSIGGILIINEPYKILSKDNVIHEEFINQLDDFDDLVVILTGKEDALKDYLGSDLDLKDKFNIFYFENYSSSELHGIFVKMLNDSNLKLDLDTDNFFKKYIDEKHVNKTSNFLNANEIEKIFKKINKNKLTRIKNNASKSDSELKRIIPEDIYDIYGKENVERVMYQIVPKNNNFDEIPKGELKFININLESSFSSSNRVTYIYNSKELNVEELVKEYYEEKGYFAIESENDYWWMIYGLLFWDIIFMKTDTCTSVPMNDSRFNEQYSLLKSHKFKDMPKDFFKSTFYMVREEPIKKRIRELMNSNISKEIEKSYFEHFGEKCRPIEDWNKFTINDLTISSRLLLKKQLLCIMARLLINFNDNRRGFPDLIVFNNEEFFFVEVKSKNDTLSKEQIECHRFLMDKVKVDVIIVSVNKSKTQIGNMKKRYYQ